MAYKLHDVVFRVPSVDFSDGVEHNSVSIDIEVLSKILGTIQSRCEFPIGIVISTNGRITVSLPYYHIEVVHAATKGYAEVAFVLHCDVKENMSCI